MNIIVDTHILIWILNEPDKLSNSAKKILLEGNPNVLVSAATIWELSIKSANKKITITNDWLKAINESGFRNLDITLHHAKLAGQLPHYHKDPFDRMLVAQAICEDFYLLTHDKMLKKYEAKILLA